VQYGAGSGQGSEQGGEQNREGGGGSTHVSVHLPVDAVPHQQRVRQFQPVGLHGVTGPIVVVAPVDCPRDGRHGQTGRGGEGAPAATKTRLHARPLHSLRGHPAMPTRRHTCAPHHNAQKVCCRGTAGKGGRGRGEVGGGGGRTSGRPATHALLHTTACLRRPHTAHRSHSACHRAWDKQFKYEARKQPCPPRAGGAPSSELSGTAPVEARWPADRTHSPNDPSLPEGTR
jgi:hypothetical protein